ncbi:hypothetical protein J7X13_004646 [Vibrio parahaemolyticus]|uniref:hypothetical protein n=1 Tax=Vibrio parahaemolyticus TaxID=670 RepID=UPI00084AF4AB|nr:hypothetical protein [Vibrio parahaemolyticus]EHH2503380.1 hypothetical protein [Vibrio parahaemolyticus]OEA52804.1 hypothetical protein BBM65_20040 [Vibrio parahaemolyticus]
MNYEFLKPKELKIEIRKPNQKYTGIIPEHSVLAAFTSLATNALLRCEQRNADAAAHHLNH